LYANHGIERAVFVIGVLGLNDDILSENVRDERCVETHGEDGGTLANFPHSIAERPHVGNRCAGNSHTQPCGQPPLGESIRFKEDDFAWNIRGRKSRRFLNETFRGILSRDDAAHRTKRGDFLLLQQQNDRVERLMQVYHAHLPQSPGGQRITHRYERRAAEDTA